MWAYVQDILLLYNKEKKKKAKIQNCPSNFQFLSFQSSNFQFCHFSSLSLKFCQCSLLLEFSYIFPLSGSFFFFFFL